MKELWQNANDTGPGPTGINPAVHDLGHDADITGFNDEVEQRRPHVSDAVAGLMTDRLGCSHACSVPAPGNDDVNTRSTAEGH